MIEESSLVLLANVALDNRPKIVQRAVCQKGPKSRNKTLRITKVNGEDHAEITDLKCMPISFLFKIFIHTFEDKKLRCSVYVCKYEEKHHCCNTRFIDVKENRITRLEHLVQCHLLEHLTKTKTGSMIRLPKMVPALEENIQSISKSKLIVKPRSKLKYEEIEWKSEEGKIVDSVAAKIVEKASSKAVPLQELEIIKIDDNIPKRIRTKEAILKKLECRSTSTDGTTRGNALRRIKVDHPYSNINKPSSNVTTGFPSRYAVIPMEYQHVNVNKLYYLNGESSSELNSFMIHETLNEPVSIMITDTDDGKSTFDQLPLVGSEAEVTTEEEVEAAVDDECRPRLDESYFPCSKCDIVLSSKQVLYSHMRNKHFDATMVFKPYKEPTRTRTVAAEPKTVKRKFEMLTEYRNADLYEVVKENNGNSDAKCVNGQESILKAALLKESNKKPVINISNVWNNINVQYV